MDLFIEFLQNFVFKNYVDLITYTTPLLLFVIIFFIRKNLINFIIQIIKKYIYSNIQSHIHSTTIIFALEMITIGSAIYPIYLATEFIWIQNIFYLLIVSGVTLGITESINLIFDLLKPKYKILSSIEKLNFEPIFRQTVKIIVYISAVLFMIHVLYPELSFMPFFIYLALLSVAFILSARDYISNFLGAMVILISRPFSIKDKITIGEIEGTVERLGLQQLQLKLKDRSIIYIPNKTITSEIITKQGK